MSGKGMTKAFILMKGTNKNIVRIWVDKKGLPYKVEVRNGNLHGYLNVDEFVDRVTWK